MLKTKFKKYGVGALAAAMATVGLAGCTGSNSTNATETITIGYVNWAECVAASNIWKNILEDQGYDVKLTQLDVAPLYVGLSTGDVDIFLDAWLPATDAEYWAKYQDDIYDAGIWYEAPAKIGLTVPSYVTIESIEEFEEAGNLFDNQIVGIDPGAGSMLVTQEAMEHYGLDSVTLVQGSETAMMAALDKAYDDGEWIAITGWSPHWMFAAYELKYLEDPDGAFGVEEEIHTLMNKDFALENPDLTTMLETFSMNDDEIGSVEKLINDGMDASEAAKQWILDNQTSVSTWLGE